MLKVQNGWQSHSLTDLERLTDAQAAAPRSSHSRLAPPIEFSSRPSSAGVHPGKAESLSSVDSVVRTPSQQTEGEKDAVETLLFLSSPTHTATASYLMDRSASLPQPLTEQDVDVLLDKMEHADSSDDAGSNLVLSGSAI